MDLVQIKNKYKQILYQSSSSSAQNSDQQGYSTNVVKNNKKRALTQLNNSQILNRSYVVTQKSLGSKQIKINNQKCQNINMNNCHQNKNKTDRSMDMLGLRQRIAQCISVIKDKDQQINKLKQRINILQQQNTHSHKQVQQLQQKLKKQCEHLVQEKAQRNILYNSIKTNEQNIQIQRLDNELLTRHIHFYQMQISKLRNQIQNWENKNKQMLVRVQDMDQLKIENKRLMEDVVRVKFLLKESDKYKKIVSKIQYKHYIGKNTHEHQCWVSGDLMNDVAKFVKKIQCSNQAKKKIQDQIVRFVDKYVRLLVEQEVKKIKKQYKMKIKDIQRKHNHSLLSRNIQQFNRKQAISLKKHKKNNRSSFSRSITQVSGYSRPVLKSVNYSRKEICIRIFQELKSKIMLELDQKQINKAKILIIIQWAIDSILSHYPEQKINENKENYVSHNLNTTNMF